MLIVNADDLGRLKPATDRALFCFARKRITSTSAMVFMEDSERAAQLALASGIDVGLHINLSESFTADSVPQSLRGYHDRIRRFLKLGKYSLLLYHPFLKTAFRYVYDAQHAEFLRLYHREPSHLDGHQHLHLASNMLMQHILPEGTKVRRSFSFRPGEKSFANRWYRAAVDRYLARRHRMTDYFFALAHHLTLSSLQPIVALADAANVELMTHPQVPGEYDFLLSDAYAEAVSQVRLAGYDGF